MNKVMKVIVPLLLILAIIASIGWYLFVYDRAFTRDMLLQQARYQGDCGNTKLASWFYNLAYKHSGQDDSVAIELANQYIAVGNYTKAEYTLTNAISDNPSVELYTALSKVFVEQDKLQDALILLDTVLDPDVQDAIDALRPAAPSPSYDSGFYSEYISVALGYNAGTVYYSTDGSFPSTIQPVYTTEILLGQGQTVVSAICVNESGLVSPLTTATYTVSGVIEPVTLQDPAIDRAIREMLYFSESHQIYSNDLWNITEFTVPEDAKDLSDLSHLIFLKTLTIENQSMETLDFLSSLTALDTLVMNHCRFPSDALGTVAALPSLQKLTMDGCGLSTISGLSGANNLVYLDLSNNTVRNLAPIAPMTGLTELYLDNNAVTNLSELTGLTKLRVLDVSYNSLTSIEPLVSCTNLQELNLNSNQLSDISVLGSLGNLSVLKADRNMLSDVSVLAQCVGLTHLSISDNQVEDISALSVLVMLEYFNFSYNQVEKLPAWTEGALRTIDGSHNLLENIDVLKCMADLSYVYMDYNAITNVDALEACYKLVQVNIYGNEVADVSALTEHDIIVNYDPTVS